MSTIINMLRPQSGPGRGRAVTVYDGRTWPVVKCGAVYVTDTDKTKTVTKNVVSLSTSDDKKVKSSKYTLAIGSSFGHVHGFLKDTDQVLKALDKHKVEDKCLMLIRKPKSASKQMLKAHSWANLNVSDMHQRSPDGSVIPDLFRSLKDKRPIKARASDLSLSLPVDANLSGLTRTASELATLDSKSLSDLDLAKTELSDKPLKHDKKKDLNIPNVYSQYPVKLQTKDITDVQDVPSLNLGQKESEVNDKIMGQGYSTVQGQVQLMPQGANRNSSLPPSVPNNLKTQNDKRKSNPNLRNSQSEAEKSKNRNLSRSKSDSDENMLYIHTKHDSGFYSDTRPSKDEMYDYGFKHELETNDEHMTSSPRSKGDNKMSDKNASKNITGHVIREKSSGMRPEGQSYNQYQGQGNRGSKGSPYYTLRGSVENVNVQLERPSSQSDRRPPSQSDRPPSSGRNQNSGVSDPDNKENIQRKYGSKVNLQVSDGYKEQSLNTSNDNLNNNKSAPSNSFRSDREVGKRKSASDMKESIKISIENGEPVIRTKSLGDLQTGCAFSLVGQRKVENTSVNQVNESGEFTGSKMTAYYRKIREMRKESKHGSLPFHGRNVDLEGLARIAEQLESQSQRQTGYQPNLSTTKSNRPKHYGSLQHLPMSGTSYSQLERDARHIFPTRKHIKTPVKPKRCLPQVPADADQKKKNVNDLVKVRMGAGSQSSSSPGSNSNQSNRAASNEGRYGFPPNATPSDKEVSELLDNPQYSEVDCNGGFMPNPVTTTATKQILPSELYSHPAIESINNTGHSQSVQSTQHFVSVTGGRLCESGQTTLTSQSTVDSGYATNDPEHETIPTSIYAKSLKQSAQTLYKSNKLLKPSKGEHPQGFAKVDNPPLPPNNVKGGHSSETISRETVQKVDRTPPRKTDNLPTRHAKDIHTQNWVNKHPGPVITNPGREPVYTGKDRHVHHYQSMGNLSLYSTPKHVKMDNNNNNNNNARLSQPPLPMSSMSESYPQDYGSLDRSHDHSNIGTYPPKRQQLSHHPSELSVKEVGRMNNQESSHVRSKGKSLSMSQGLNLIHTDSSQSYGHNQPLAKTHPKFTGSLKDLIGVGKQIVPVEILKREDFHQSTGALFQNNQGNQETSLKSLGKPSLFQILQNYNLYTVRMRVPEHLNITENIRMIECEVVLPSSYIFGGETPLSPKGNYAKIGGPNSAFRPVATGVATVKTVSMVTVLDISNNLAQSFHSGQIKKGDLIVELNERLMIGEELSTLTSMLKSYKGEVIVTVARDKAREIQQYRDKNSSSPVDADFKLMEQKIVELTKTLQKRDRTIHKLNAFLPWQSPGGKGRNSAESNIEPIISNLSEDEYIV